MRSQCLTPSTPITAAPGLLQGVVPWSVPSSAEPSSASQGDIDSQCWNGRDPFLALQEVVTETNKNSNVAETQQ